MVDIWTKRILVVFGGVLGGAYLIPFAGILNPYPFSFSIGVFAFLISTGVSVFVAFAVISSNRQKYLRKLRSKKSLLLISAIFVGIFFAGMYGSVGINPVLHALISEEDMQKEATKSTIVRAYQEMYPENHVRFVDYPAAPPAMVLEAEKDGRLARLMIGGFERDSLGYGFSCSTTGVRENSLFYVNVNSTKDITGNVCFNDGDNNP